MKYYQKPVAEVVEIAVDEEIMTTTASGTVRPNPGDIDLS